jgi:DNA-binding response OmpR family regulator
VPGTARSTILVVDDEAEICDLVSYNLGREGYRVIAENDGAAGLDRIFKSPPDLVVLDLLLPKMSGLEVLDAIRGEARTKALPVLVLTARGTEMDKLVGFERGADDYLTKPFSPKELVARVSAILRRTRGEERQAPTVIGPVRFDPDRARREKECQEQQEVDPSRERPHGA